jgi:hypothetical protein
VEGFIDEVEPHGGPARPAVAESGEKVVQQDGCVRLSYRLGSDAVCLATSDQEKRV